jgi:hypothetical protein
MSKFSKILAGLTLAIGVAVAAPQAANAQWHHHGGHWHGGGWGGFGPGFALGFGIGAAPYYGYGPYYAAPYAYGPGGCGWVRTRVWRHGYWVVRRVWRCW